MLCSIQHNTTRVMLDRFPFFFKEANIMKRLVVSALLAAMILSAAACGVKPMNDEFYICSMAGHSRNSGSQQLFETKDAVYYLCAFREPKKPNRNKSPPRRDRR